MGGGLKTMASDRLKYRLDGAFFQMVDQILIDIFAYGHVLGAIGWLGGGLLTGLVIGPNMRNLAPGAGLEFNAKVLPKMVRFVQAAVGVTLLFGILLFLEVGSGLTSTQFDEIGFGVALAVVTGIIAFAMTIPSFNRVAKIANEALKAGTPPSPDIMKYAKRARQGSLVGLGLLLIVLAAMVASGFS
jgi:uncharacterized membrane protein